MCQVEDGVHNFYNEIFTAWDKIFDGAKLPCGIKEQMKFFKKMQKTAEASLAAIILTTGVFSPACGVSSAPAPDTNAVKQPLPPVSVSQRQKIVAFGDSLTAGFGLAEKESYPYLLQQKLDADGYDFEVINAGISGDTSAGGADRIDWSLNQPNVKVLILELGGNDLLRGLPAKKMKENLREIIRAAHAKNVTVLLCGLSAPPSAGNAYFQELVRAYEDLAREEKVAFMPHFVEGVAGRRELNQADGIHPNAEGEKIIADNVYKNLKPILQKLPKN